MSGTKRHRWEVASAGSAVVCQHRTVNRCLDCGVVVRWHQRPGRGDRGVFVWQWPSGDLWREGPLRPECGAPCPVPGRRSVERLLADVEREAEDAVRRAVRTKVERAAARRSAGLSARKERPSVPSDAELRAQNQAAAELREAELRSSFGAQSSASWGDF